MGKSYIIFAEGSAQKYFTKQIFEIPKKPRKAHLMEFFRLSSSFVKTFQDPYLSEHLLFQTDSRLHFFLPNKRGLVKRLQYFDYNT